MNDALILIDGCQEATVVSLDTRREEAKIACAEVARHLACHDIKARTEVLVVEDIGIMDMLLNQVADRTADLLVMGAHGHVGLKDLVFGNTINPVRHALNVPILVVRGD